MDIGERLPDTTFQKGEGGGIRPRENLSKLTPEDLPVDMVEECFDVCLDDVGAVVAECVVDDWAGIFAGETVSGTNGLWQKGGFEDRLEQTLENGVDVLFADWQDGDGASGVVGSVFFGEESDSGGCEVEGTLEEAGNEGR